MSAGTNKPWEELAPNEIGVGVSTLTDAKGWALYCARYAYELAKVEAEILDERTSPDATAALKKARALLVACAPDRLCEDLRNHARNRFNKEDKRRASQ